MLFPFPAYAALASPLEPIACRRRCWSCFPPFPAVYLTVELGLQTIHDKTAEQIRRGHTYREFLEGYRALQARGIRTCIHLINGLPGETEEDMLESARAVGKLRPQGIKLHLLHVLKGTDLAALWHQGKMQAMEKEPYIRLVCSQLEVFPRRLLSSGSRETVPGSIFWRLFGALIKSPFWEESTKNSKTEIHGRENAFLHKSPFYMYIKIPLYMDMLHI